MSAATRMRQGVRALAAFASPIDHDQAADVLTPDLLALFARLKRMEQIHCLNVLRALRSSGAVDRDLAVAALLHDVGKTRWPLPLWQKVIAVLMRRFAPGTAARLASGDPAHPLARPFVVYAHHPAWSAELLRAAGASDVAVWLAAHHADDPARWRDHPLYPALVRLQRADDLN